MEFNDEIIQDNFLTGTTHAFLNVKQAWKESHVKQDLKQAWKESSVKQDLKQALNSAKKTTEKTLKT